MANLNIGVIPCPICGLDAHVRETKKTKAYILCDDCGFQGFARGFSADKTLREKMRAIVAAVVDLPVITVKPAVTLEKLPVITVKPAVNAVTENTTPTVKELTIFDKDFWKGKDHATSN